MYSGNHAMLYLKINEKQMGIRWKNPLVWLPAKLTTGSSQQCRPPWGSPRLSEHVDSSANCRWVKFSLLIKWLSKFGMTTVYCNFLPVCWLWGSLWEGEEKKGGARGNPMKMFKPHNKRTEQTTRGVTQQSRRHTTTHMHGTRVSHTCCRRGSTATQQPVCSI